MNLRLIIFLAFAIGVGCATAAETKVAPAVEPAAKPAASVPASAAPASPRNESAVAPTASFDTFRLITDRNMFNANRTGRRDRSTEERAPRLDTITLVGTMDSDKGLRAFFDGSDSGYRKALRVGEAIDKYKVTKIVPNTVDLERDGKSLSVRVGQQLRRPEGADWTLVGEDLVLREAQAKAAADAASRVDPNAPPVIPAGASDILRKMMEARAKQLTK